jgi:peptide/nickel transport system substrate-binding protein
MSKGRKLLVIIPVFLSLVLLLLLPACTSTPTSTSPTASTAPVTSTSPATSTTPAISTSAKPSTSTAVATTVAASTPAKKMVIAIKAFGDNYEMLSSAMSYPNIVTVAANVFERFVNREPSANGIGKVIPGLCESWTISPDGLQIQFTLRKGVKFHSGDPLTTADIQFSYERALKDPFVKGNFTIDHLQIVDDYHFTYFFKTPDVTFIAAELGYPVESKKYYDRVGEAEFVKHPVGTGPYKIVDFKSGEYIDLEAFADYWGGAPAIKQVRFRFVAEDSTRVAMLKTGEADMINQVPYPIVADINKTKGLKTLSTSAGNRTVFIKFQNVNPKTPWYDIRVRQAFALAINRDSIVKDIQYNLVQSYPALGPGDIGYDPQLPHYEFNPTKAKSLLAEAGYSKGLKLTLNYMSGEIYGLKETAEAVAAYLNQAGFIVDLVSWEGPKWAEYNMKASNNPDMDYISMGIAGVANVPDSTSGLYNQYSRKTQYAGYFNQTVNDLAVQSRTVMDDNARADVIKQAWRLIHDDYGYIPLFTAARIYGIKDNMNSIASARGTGQDVIMVNDITVK